MTGPLVFRSRLDAPAAPVWDHATSEAGINDELEPLLRMTAPRGVERLGAACVTSAAWCCSPG